MKTNKTTQRYGTMLRIFDNGGATFDRYTIMPAKHDKKYRDHRVSVFDCIASSENPFHPQGFGLWTSASAGKHLGSRVHWNTLPEQVQKFAKQSFPEYFPPQNEQLF